MSYLKRITHAPPPQSAPIPGSTQVPNSAGGFAWAVDDWTRLRRFLVLGSEGGSYYASERELTLESAEAVARCIGEDGLRAVATIVERQRGRSGSEERPGALRAGDGGRSRRRRDTACGAGRPAACRRTGTHLFQFAQLVEGFRGWGRSLRRGIGRWYAEQPVDALAYQAVKYRQREGVTHRDLLRLAHPAARGRLGQPDARRVGRAPSAVRVDRPRRRHGRPAANRRGLRSRTGGEDAGGDGGARPRVRPAARGAPERAPHLAGRVGGAARGHAVDGADPQPRDDDAHRPAGSGLGRDAARPSSQLGDAERIRRARVHPIAVLAALRTYEAGRGARGRGEWAPVREIVDALDAAFYAAFANVEPAGTRLLLALDVSGSMQSGRVAGVPGLSPRDASAALALVTAATEPEWRDRRLLRGSRRLEGRLSTPVVRRRERPDTAGDHPAPAADDAVQAVSGLPFGATDCALPMLYARARKLEIDTFVIYTDSETWAGEVHPAQALREYRAWSGIDARLVVVGMVANAFSIADPGDPGQLDVVGFDTATPQLIADFARGSL